MALLPKNLRHHLQLIQSSSISENELTAFVHFCRSIVEPYLQYVRKSVNLLCEQQGVTITDLAEDCIAEAFARDDNGKFPQLENFINSLSAGFDTIPDHNLLLAFRKFLTCVADAQLARLYALSDPAGAKIHRNIQLCVGKWNSQFELVKEIQGLVLLPLGGEVLDHLEDFPLEEIAHRIGLQQRNQRTIPDLLKSLHDILIEQASYCRSILLVDVVKLFKTVYASDIDLLDDEGSEFFGGGLTEFEIDNIFTKIKRALEEKIVTTYLMKEKLNRGQAEAIVNAFQDMFSDWRTSATQDPSLHEYLSRYLPVDKKTFDLEFKPKMTYLLSFLRSELKVFLLKDI